MVFSDCNNALISSKFSWAALSFHCRELGGSCRQWFYRLQTPASTLQGPSHPFGLCQAFGCFFVKLHFSVQIWIWMKCLAFGNFSFWKLHAQISRCPLCWALVASPNEIQKLLLCPPGSTSPPQLLTQMSLPLFFPGILAPAPPSWWAQALQLPCAQSFTAQGATATRAATASEDKKGS